MQLLDEQLIVSASDLNNFLACPHLTTLDLANARAERPDAAEGRLLVFVRGSRRSLGFRSRPAQLVLECLADDLGNGDAAPIGNPALAAELEGLLTADRDERRGVGGEIDVEKCGKRARAEGGFVIFLIDDDGFMLKQDGEYLLPAEIREGNTWARLSGDMDQPHA